MRPVAASIPICLAILHSLSLTCSQNAVASEDRSVCAKALAPLSEAEMIATGSYLKLLHSLAVERNVASAEFLERLSRQDSAVSPFSLGELPLPAEELWAYRKAFGRLLLTGSVRWDVVTVEIAKVAAQKRAAAKQTAVAKETARPSMGIVHRETISRPELDGDGDLHIFPHDELKSADHVLLEFSDPKDKFERRFRLFRLSDTHFAEVEGMFSEYRLEGKLLKASDGRTVGAFRHESGIRIFDANTGKAVLGVPENEIEGFKDWVLRGIGYLLYRGPGRVLKAFGISGQFRDSVADIDLATKKFRPLNLPHDWRYSYVISEAATSDAGDTVYAVGTRQVAGQFEVQVYDLTSVELPKIAETTLAIDAEKPLSRDVRANLFEAVDGTKYLSVVGGGAAKIINLATKKIFGVPKPSESPNSRLLERPVFFQEADGSLRAVTTVEWIGEPGHSKVSIRVIDVLGERPSELIEIPEKLLNNVVASVLVQPEAGKNILLIPGYGTIGVVDLSTGEMHLLERGTNFIFYGASVCDGRVDVILGPRYRDGLSLQRFQVYGPL